MIPFIRGVWNNRFADCTKTAMINTETFPIVRSSRGDLFYVSPDLFTVEQCINDYCWTDIRKDDVVLDIGANIGGFAIPVSRMVKRVIAVEPICVNELQKNRILNNILPSQLWVYDVALSDAVAPILQWRKRREVCRGLSFKEILSVYPPVSFLKCDAEGAERFINPDDLSGIRRIEMELHKPFHQELIDYVFDEFECADLNPWGKTAILHAWRE